MYTYLFTYLYSKDFFIALRVPHEYHYFRMMFSFIRLHSIFFRNFVYRHQNYGFAF